VECRSSSSGVGGCHKERFKGNGNFLGWCKEGGFEQIVMKEERALAAWFGGSVGLRRFGQLLVVIRSRGDKTPLENTANNLDSYKKLSILHKKYMFFRDVCFSMSKKLFYSADFA